MKKEALQCATSFIKERSAKASQGGVYIARSKDGQEVYRLGIIDFLTDYNTAKKLENKFNNVRYGKDKQGASCQKPDVYADRFIKFMNEKL